VTALEETRDNIEARTRSLESRFARAQTIVAIGPQDGRSIKPHQSLEVSATANGILLRSSGLDPIAWLPVRPPPFVHSIARIDMTAPGPTWLQLFWSTREVPHPSEEQSTLIHFPRGRHVRWAEIPAADHVGRLRLDPAGEPGDYVLHSLELRCETGGRARAQSGLAGLWHRLRAQPELLSTPERFQRGQPVLDRGALASGFTVLRGVRVDPGGDGLILRCVDGDPQIELAALELSGQRVIARLDATSSIPTTAQMFWGTRQRSYCEEQSAVVSLSPDRSSGYFEIPREARGRLRFDPASSPCEVHVHSLEIRSEA
jgi:hypothetical protein